jgi:tetratricopeptide (TPR) repeat protein
VLSLFGLQRHSKHTDLKRLLKSGKTKLKILYIRSSKKKLNLMNKFNIACLAFVLLASTAISAQLRTPQPSPKCTISQVVGLSDIEVEYSRPGMKGRKIFGGLLAYGEMWRLGANASTKFSTSKDVSLGGFDVPAGDYSLYAIPGEKEWTIIVHKDITLNGTGGYDMANDLGRFTVVPTRSADTFETLTIDFSTFTTVGADLCIRWENTLVRIPIKTHAIEEVEAQIKKEIIDGPGAGDYAAAARFYLSQEKNYEQSLTWIDMAIKGSPDAFWYVHNKAQILAKLGRKKEAISAAEKSMEMAKANEDGDYGYVENNQKLIAEIKATK